MLVPALRRARHLTIQSRIALLVIACIVPAWLSAAFISYLSYEHERDNIRKHTLETARGLMRVVERDLAANVAALQTLATLSDFDPRDFAAFYRDAQRVLSFTSGFTIVLADTSGDQLVNLLLPLGAALPRHGNPRVLQRVLDTRNPVVSDLYIGGVTKTPVVSIDVPVVRSDKVLYSLAMGIDPEHLAGILQEQHLPPEWVVSIFDSTGTIVARNLAPRQFIGQKGSAPLLKGMQEAHEGTLDVPTLEGIPVMAAFSRSATFGWTVAIGVPESIVTADIRQSLRLDAIGGGMILLLGLFLAGVIGRTIAQPIRALIAPALSIGRGHSVSIPPLHLKEADEVGQALLQAQQLLHQRERERDEAEKAERQMQVAKKAAEQANEAKAKFLANMSHELRTPLNAILGFSRLMRTSPHLAPEHAQNLDIIARSGEHLLSLINNVLEISKIESGHVEVNAADIDLAGLLDDIRGLMSVQAQEKGLRFTVALSPDVPRTVVADAGKLRQVLINLTANAIRFTAKGAVSVRAGVAAQFSAQRARLRFEVEDTGSGIREEDTQRIFSPFVQLDSQPVGPGTGLGLAISKQYVELMGGHIGVRSMPGEGSLFYFEIPVGISALATGLTPATAAPDRLSDVRDGNRRYRVLIAEDHRESRLLLRKLLEPFGFELQDATNGVEAIRLVEQWHPHLVWMDMRMPEMDGLEATRRIRASDSGDKIKIIALTAHAPENETREILAAGCDDVLRKPYREAEVFDALTRHLGVRFVHPGSQSPTHSMQETPTAAQLRQLPRASLEALRSAAVLLDRQRCFEAVRTIGQVDERLGACLNRMIEHFQYSELLSLLDASLQ